jgi:hypothetical protein
LGVRLTTSPHKKNPNVKETAMKPRNQKIDSRRTGYGKGQRDRKWRGRSDVTLATWNKIEENRNTRMEKDGGG